jgi:hypothetical protein
MTRGDKFLLAGLLFASLLSMAALYGRFSFFPGTAESVRAVISVQGKTVRIIDLPAGARSTIVVNGRLGPSSVEVEGTRVRMPEAPCPGKICVSQGWISHPGQSIVCIPGEILVRIEGAAPVDAVTR